MADTVPTPVLDTRDEDSIAAEAIGGLPSELSDRSDSNPAVVLLEAGAFEIGKLLFQINQWPSSVIQKVLAICGITLEPACAATVQQTFTLSSPQVADTSIPAGSDVATSNGETVFETTADLTIAAYSSPAGNITLTSGSTAVSCDNPTFVTGTTWVGWKIHIQGTSTWYTIASVTNTTSLVLTSTASSTATGAYDVGPVSGTTSAQATTTGTTTNVGADTLTTIQSSIANVASTTNAAAATGGTDAETIAEAIDGASTKFATRDTAITESDFEEFAQKILGSGSRAKAQANTNIITGSDGYTSVACLSRKWTSSVTATALERAAVARDLAQRSFSGSTVIDLAASIDSLTGPSVAIYRKSNYDAVTAQEMVAAALNSYANPNTYTWGRTLYVTDLVKVVENVDCIDRVHEINGVPAIGSSYTAAPAAITFASSATATTADTSFVTDRQTFIIDATNNAVYLIISHVNNTSITFDRAWAGTAGAATPYYFKAADDDMNSGGGEIWYKLPYANIITPYSQIVVVGSV